MPPANGVGGGEGGPPPPRGFAMMRRAPPRGANRAPTFRTPRPNPMPRKKPGNSSKPPPRPRAGNPLPRGGRPGFAPRFRPGSKPPGPQTPGGALLTQGTNQTLGKPPVEPQRGPLISRDSSIDEPPNVEDDVSKPDTAVPQEKAASGGAAAAAKAGDPELKDGKAASSATKMIEGGTAAGGEPMPTDTLKDNGNKTTSGSGDGMPPPRKGPPNSGASAPPRRGGLFRAFAGRTPTDGRPSPWGFKGPRPLNRKPPAGISPRPQPSGPPSNNSVSSVPSSSMPPGPDIDKANVNPPKHGDVEGSKDTQGSRDAKTTSSDPTKGTEGEQMKSQSLQGSTPPKGTNSTTPASAGSGGLLPPKGPGGLPPPKGPGGLPPPKGSGGMPPPKGPGGLPPPKGSGGLPLPKGSSGLPPPRSLNGLPPPRSPSGLPPPKGPGGLPPPKGPGGLPPPRSSGGLPPPKSPSGLPPPKGPSGLPPSKSPRGLPRPRDPISRPGMLRGGLRRAPPARLGGALRNAAKRPPLGSPKQNENDDTRKDENEKGRKSAVTMGGGANGNPPGKMLPPKSEQEAKKMNSNLSPSKGLRTKTQNQDPKGPQLNPSRVLPPESAPRPTPAPKRAPITSPTKSKMNGDEGLKHRAQRPKPMTPGKIVDPRPLAHHPNDTGSDLKSQLSEAAAGTKDLDLGSMDLSSLNTNGIPTWATDDLKGLGIGAPSANGRYRMADQAERKKYSIPIPPASQTCGGCGSRNGEQNEMIHWKADLPFFAGVGLKSGRVVLGGGGGAAGMGVGSGIKIYDIRRDCALIPFADFDSNDKLVNCIAEHPCGSEIALAMDGAVHAYLASSDGEMFELVDAWVVIPRTHTTSTSDQPPGTPGHDDDDEEDEPEQVTVMEFDPRGRILATGGEDGKVRVWNYQSKQMMALINATDPGEDVTSIAFTPDSKYILICVKKPYVIIYDLEKKQEAKRITPPPQYQNCIFRHLSVVRKLQQGGNEDVHETYFALASLVDLGRNGWSYMVRMRVGGDWSVQSMIPAIQETATAMAVSRDGITAALSTREGGVAIVNTTSMRRTRIARNCHSLPGTALCFAGSEGDTLVTASMDKSYALIPIERYVPPQTHGCINGVFRLLFQVIAVIIIAHVIQYHTI